MGEIKEYLDFGAALITPIAAIVLSLYGWKKTGEIDLRKTLLHAVDVVHIVKEGIDKDGNEEKALNGAVSEVEKLRGKKLSTKLRRKLKARLTSIHNGSISLTKDAE
jgi:hypothetical protein